MPTSKRSNLLLFFALCATVYGKTQNNAVPTTSSTVQQDGIRLNQVGFYPAGKKVAVITNAKGNERFYIISAEKKDTLFRGTLSEERQSAFSSTKTRIADLSTVTKPGKYLLLYNGNQSFPFDINNGVYKPAAIAVLKGYYFQRASMPLEEKYAGKWMRQGFHPDNVVYIHPSAASAKRAAGSVISTPGGWYDAGDYNKYIVNSGITMGTLLSAYEDFPDYYNKLNTAIPESEDAVPDILNEVIYNLRWMLTMQDPEDGGVYNKCTNAEFDGMVMPGVTKAERYVVQKGTAATLDFAAVTAQASRILKHFNKQLPGLADSCATASKAGWKWATLNPAMEYDQNAINKKFKPVVSTGGYGDKKFSDEWLWASSELFLTTGDEQYLAKLQENINDGIDLPNWGNVAMLGAYSMLRFKKALPAKCANVLKGMEEKVIGIADVYVEKTASNAFQTVMGQSKRDFNWGSNSNAANQGVLLVKAFLLTGKEKYLEMVMTNVDYLLGRNATGYSFITGIGTKTPMFIHHRQSEADSIVDPVPGLVAGGPNPGMQDKCKYDFFEPETAYSDVACSYASNEIAINWNAPVVYLLNAVQSLSTRKP